MEYGLSGAQAVIDYGTETLDVDFPLTCQLSRNLEKMSERWFIFGRGFFERWQMLSWSDKKMNGRLGVEVLERNAGWVFVNNLGWQLTVNNAAKNAVFHFVLLNSRCS
jgi:hypothetical protein